MGNGSRVYDGLNLISYQVSYAQPIPMYIPSLKTAEKPKQTLQTKRSKHVAGSYQLPPLPIFVKKDQ
jgi:hypothetical protein